MSSQPTLTTRIQVTIRELIAKLRALLTLPPPPQRVPVRARSDKETDRWRNEGGH